MSLPQKSKTIILVLIIFGALIITVIRVLSALQKDNAKQINSNIISSFSKSYFNTGNSESKKVLLFVDFTDFGCSSCSEGVAAICRSLNSELKVKERKNVLIMIRKRKGTEEYYSWLVKDWRKENDIVFPIMVDKDNFFEQTGINKTSVAIIDKDQKVIEYKEFPMQGKEIRRILSKFLN